MTSTYPIKAGVILKNGDKYLIVKEKDKVWEGKLVKGKWGFPKGHMEDGKTDPSINDNNDPKITAIRELKEETGIEIDYSVLSDEKMKRFEQTFRSNGRIDKEFAYFYIVDLEDNKDKIKIPSVFVPNNEIEKILWVTPNNVKFMFKEFTFVNNKKMNKHFMNRYILKFFNLTEMRDTKDITL